MKPTHIKAGQRFTIHHYIAEKHMEVTALNDEFRNDDGDREVGIQFDNGDKAYAVFVPEEENPKFFGWELGDGDYFGE